MKSHFNQSVLERQAGTFAVDVAVASRQPPVKVEGAYRLYVTVPGAVEQHSLLDVQCALHFSQLGFLPKERHFHLQTWTLYVFASLCVQKNSHLQKNSHKSKFWILCMHLMG